MPRLAASVRSLPCAAVINPPWGAPSLRAAFTFPPQTEPVGPSPLSCPQGLCKGPPKAFTAPTCSCIFTAATCRSLPKGCCNYTLVLALLLCHAAPLPLPLPAGLPLALYNVQVQVTLAVVQCNCGLAGLIAGLATQSEVLPVARTKGSDLEAACAAGVVESGWNGGSWIEHLLLCSSL